MKKLILLLVTMAMIAGCKSELSEEEQAAYHHKGKVIVQDTFKELSTQLMEKMKEGGPELALPFCNVQALPLTLDVAAKNGVEIKRVSNKLRNIKNSPSKHANDQLNAYLENQQAGIESQAVVARDEAGVVHYYAPIRIMKQCLVCHGSPGENMLHKTDSLIKSYYPEDAATGYSDGELRGMWDIAFLK